MGELRETDSYPNPKPCFECGEMCVVKHFLPPKGMCGTGQYATYLCSQHSGYGIPIKCFRYRQWTDYDTREAKWREEEAAKNNDTEEF